MYILQKGSIPIDRNKKNKYNKICKNKKLQNSKIFQKYINKRKEEKMTKVIIIIFIILLIVGGVIGAMYFIKTPETKAPEENKQSESEIEEDDIYAPIISYYDENDEKELIKEGEVYRKHLKLTYNKGTAYIKKQQDAEFEKYNDELVTDGEYTVKVETKDGKTTQKSFIIDSTPPVIKGITAGRYTTAQTIEFEDINDVKTATLTNSEGTVVNLKELGENTYNVNESGTYTLKAEDKYGNAIIPITFRITLP